MDPGERIDARWEITGSAPGEPAVGRWRAVAVGTGEPVEVLALQPAAAWSKAAHGAFLDAHRSMQRADDPALIKVLAVGWSADRAWVVRAPLEDLTLADVPGPLAPGVVAGVGARLLPAVLAADGATGGALVPRDVGFDAAGAAVLAPRARPGDRVSPEDGRYVAPEAYRGARPDGAAGLYGLGVVLYRLVTGREPIKAGAPVPAGNWVAGLPPALDRALMLLLDADPARRAMALPLLVEVAGPVPDLRRLARRPAAVATVLPGEVKLTTPAAAPLVAGRADVASPRAAVVLGAPILARLAPSERSAVAGHAGLPLAAIERLARDGLPLVLEVHRSRSASSARAAELARGTGLPIGIERAPGVVAPIVVLAMVGAAAVTGVVAAFTGFLPLFAPAALFALVALAVGLVWQNRAFGWRTALAAWNALRDRSPPSPRLAPRWERVAVLRRELVKSPLPEMAATDVRAALREVEQHLEDLQRIEEAVEEGLSSVHGSELRSRISSLASAAERDPRAAEERDRLARTLADVEAVQDRQERLRTDLARVDDALDDLAAVLAEIGTRADSGIEALLETTRIARDALAEPKPPRERDPA